MRAHSALAMDHHNNESDTVASMKRSAFRIATVLGIEKDRLNEAGEMITERGYVPMTGAKQRPVPSPPPREEPPEAFSVTGQYCHKALFDMR